MIKPSHRHFKSVHMIAVEILRELSVLEAAKPQIVEQGAVGFLLNLSRADDSRCAGHAKDVLYAIQRDSAATVAQKVAKAYIVRQRVKILAARVGGSLIMPECAVLKEQLQFPRMNLPTRG
jgi:hypothetical protein